MVAAREVVAEEAAGLVVEAKEVVVMEVVALAVVG